MPKRKTVRKQVSKPAAAASTADFNRKAQWKAYQELQIKADEAWEKLRRDVEKNAKSDVLIQDNNHLLLLLGECNYMARECMRIAGQGKRKPR